MIPKPYYKNLSTGTEIQSDQPGFKSFLYSWNKFVFRILGNIDEGEMVFSPKLYVVACQDWLQTAYTHPQFPTFELIRDSENFQILFSHGFAS